MFLSDDDVVVGARVAVPFLFRQNEVYFAGAVLRVPDDSASVSFPDERRPWQVQRDRLFEVLSLEARGRQRQLGMSRGGLFILLLIPMAGFLSYDAAVAPQA